MTYYPSHESFKDQKLPHAFFYNNRLCFLILKQKELLFLHLQKHKTHTTYLTNFIILF